MNPKPHPRRSAWPRWAGALLLAAGSAFAQTPNPSFILVGHIEKFALAPPGEGAATMTVRGIPVILPKHLLVTLPGTVPVLAEVPQRLEMAAVEETPAPVEEIAEEEEPLLPYADGVYTGSSRGYGGTVQVQVTVPAPAQAPVRAQGLEREPGRVPEAAATAGSRPAGY